MTAFRSTLLIVILCAACAPPSPSHEEDVAAITRATRDWAVAFQAGDVARASSFVTSGGVLVPPNEPVVSGREAIEAWARRLYENVTIDRVVSTTDSVRVAGDWAVSRGSWAIDLTVAGTPAVDTTRYVVIWERQPDGSWKTAYDIWNSAIPTSAAE